MAAVDSPFATVKDETTRTRLLEALHLQEIAGREKRFFSYSRGHFGEKAGIYIYPAAT